MNNLDLENLMEFRHSGRTYDTSRDVPLSAMPPLKKAAHFSPSCYNEQPWHFIIAHKKETPEAYNKIYDSLMESNQKWTKEVPILIAVVAKNYYRKNGKPNRLAQYDSGAAALAFVLAATKLGYMAHQMGGFDENKLAASFKIPQDYTPMAVMALGYEKEGEAVPPKDRRAMENHFYHGEWKNDK